MVEKLNTKVDIPKTKSSGFGTGNILGLIFVIFGILLTLNLIGVHVPFVNSFDTLFMYGAALGSILGGFSMLFKKKSTI